MAPSKKPSKKAPVKKPKAVLPAPTWNLPEVLDMDEAASYLRVSRTTVYKLAQAGNIPAFKLQGMWRFRLQSLREWTEKLEREQQRKGK